MFILPHFSINRLLTAIKRAFSPRLLFANGEQGVWYDPSDFSTLFQDAAGTIPVTAVEQPVGRINDKSGRGNHASQSTATSRPVLKQDANGKYYLLFDGIDDSFATASIDFTSTDKMSVFAGVRKLSDATQGLVVELTPALTNRFTLFAPQSAGEGYRFASGGSIPTNTTAGAYAAPETAVLTGSAYIAGDSLQLRRNGVQIGTSSTDQGTGNYANSPLYIGRRGGTTLPFNGHIYSLIIRGAQSTDAQITSAEQYVAGKTGVVL
jgi:hypothetical protein